MDKLILICFCFALLTSQLQCVSSESETEESERPVLVLPKTDLLDSITQGQQNQNLLPALSTDNELPKSKNNPNKDDNKEQLPLPVLNTYAENNESNRNSVTVSVTVSTKPIDVTSNSNSNPNNEDKLPPIFIDFKSDIEKKSDVNRSSVSNTNKNSGLAQPEKPFLPLRNTSADDDTTTDTTNKAGSVSTGKEHFSQIKNIIGLLENQELLSSFPKYQPEEQLLKHDPNSEELNKQNNRPELLQKQPYQHDKDFKTEIDRQQQNQYLHINASQKNLSERIQKLLSKSKPQLLHKKDANKRVIDVSYDDNIDDALDSYTDSNASEGNDQLYSYTKKNGSIENDSEQVHTSASDQLQQLISLQQANSKQSNFPWSPVDTKHKAFISNKQNNVIGEEDDDEEKETNSYIIDEGSEEYNSVDSFDADNVDTYSKTKTHSDKKNDVNSNEDFAKEDAFQNVNEDDSSNQTGRSNEEDEIDYKTESDNADNEDHLDDMENIGFNNQVKEDDSNNQTGRSNEEDETVYKTESDKADSENEEDDLEDIENVSLNTHSSVDDDSIDEEEDTAVDNSNKDEAEEISDVDANTAVALYKEAVNSTLLSESHSKNDQDTERRLVSDNSEEDNDDWFYQEKNNDDDDEDYTENEGSKDDSEEYKDEGDDFVLGEHDNDDDDEEYDVTKWTQHGGDDDDDTDWDDETEDDFDESKSHLVDEQAKKNKQPTAPTRMVLFYTWMIVAVLLIIVGVSTYQSRCKGFRFFGTKASNPKDDRKRLMEHEFV